VLTGEATGEGAIFRSSGLDCPCEGDFAPLFALDLGATRTADTGPRACPDLGSAPLSLEYADGRFYVGAADGPLFRSGPYAPQDPT